MSKKEKFILGLNEIGVKDVSLVGGKNASLGEMIQFLEPKGIRVPGGFVVTAAAYFYFLEKTGLKKFIRDNLKDLDIRNLRDLVRRGKLIRETIKKTDFPAELKKAIIVGYRKFHKPEIDVAVRSSATAEDLPSASFAGEHETYLNIRGAGNVLKAVRASMASLFTDRAISYRADKGFDHFKIGLSVGVEKMVRSDLPARRSLGAGGGCSGVMFTLDTETGFKDMVLINGSWGLGEMIVQGEVTPDEFLVFKPTRAIIDKKLGVKNQKMVYSRGLGIKKTKIIKTLPLEKKNFILSDKEILTLAKWGQLIETHYSKKYNRWAPMDIEWAKDGRTGELFIVQARPETVQAAKDFSKIKEYVLNQKGKVLLRGISVGSKIASGKARVILNVKNINQFQKSEVLVTKMTDPDWEPIMKIAAAIVTDKGGRTSHAAIVSRELGIPCIVGSENATQRLKTGQMITVDTSGEQGLVFQGALKFKIVEHDIKKIPKPKTKIMVNIATPDTAFEKSFLPVAGVGLAREEFIIASDIGIHPMVLINFQKDKKRLASSVIKEIEFKTNGWLDKKQFYIDKLAFGIAKICAAFYPRPVIVRFSDFKTNEYRALLGGDFYEPQEENPMIGWRGASRYYHQNFAPAFVLECQAVKTVRQQIGLKNLIPMIPFCRTLAEAGKVLNLMKQNGLSKAEDKSLKIYMMCEIPSNVVLVNDFLKLFDGLSIGSNDLTQLTVGIDRDASELVRAIANENNAAVRILISQVIEACRKNKKYSGICGQGPSDLPDFARFLVQKGIESISLNPDAVVKAMKNIHRQEKYLKNK